MSHLPERGYLPLPSRVPYAYEHMAVSCHVICINLLWHVAVAYIFSLSPPTPLLRPLLTLTSHRRQGSLTNVMSRFQWRSPIFFFIFWRMMGKRFEVSVSSSNTIATNWRVRHGEKNWMAIHLRLHQIELTNLHGHVVSANIFIFPSNFIWRAWVGEEAEKHLPDSSRDHPHRLRHCEVVKFMQTTALLPTSQMCTRAGMRRWWAES